MFVIGIFCFIFGLFAWLIYGSKRLIEEVEKEHALIDEVKTYDISDKHYWVSFDTIVGAFFTLLGFLFLFLFFLNPPRNNNIPVILMAVTVFLLMMGLSVLMLYPKYYYRVLTKNRPVTFDPINKLVRVREKEGELIFSLAEIEIILDYTTTARIDARYWEVRLKNGEIVLFDPRFWPGITTEKFFRGVPKQVVNRWIPWFEKINE
jgi:hypothetical protein